MVACVIITGCHQKSCRCTCRRRSVRLCWQPKDRNVTAFTERSAAPIRSSHQLSLCSPIHSEWTTHCSVHSSCEHHRRRCLSPFPLPPTNKSWKRQLSLPQVKTEPVSFPMTWNPRVCFGGWHNVSQSCTLGITLQSSDDEWDLIRAWCQQKCLKYVKGTVHPKIDVCFSFYL